MRLPGRVSGCLATGAIAATACFAGLAVVAPLATYTVTLAVFGLPHVLSELRYVDRRFGRRLERCFLIPMAVLLPAIATIRAGVVLHVIPVALGLPAELGGVVLLALACARGAAERKSVALLVAGAIGGATAFAPYATAVTLSILHNLTPLGFMWQIAPRTRRGRMMAWATAGFVGLPLLIATGWPRAALDRFFGSGATFDPLNAGPLAANLFVYVWPPLVTAPKAVDLFTASVVAQGAHYAAVIIILPFFLSRLDPQARGLISWPRGTIFALLCLGIGAIGLARFMDGFAGARALYGIAASFHAWIEIPVLILALTGGTQRSSQSPSSSDPEFAISETSIARSTRSPAIHAMSPPSTITTTASRTMIDGQ
jgi:hypothetical protein